MIMNRNRIISESRPCRWSVRPEIAPVRWNGHLQSGRAGASSTPHEGAATRENGVQGQTPCAYRLRADSRAEPDNA